MLGRLALTPGEAVLDVGCGPGTDPFDMAELVGPAGSLVGLDASEVMIDEARRRAAERDLTRSRRWRGSPVPVDESSRSTSTGAR
jgi:ubiquinone/menaquinone biosynthesis C-methylase UbiE